MKLLRHVWKANGFKKHICSQCGCEKQHIEGRLTFYFRSGMQLSNLPECRRIIHSDKVL